MSEQDCLSSSKEIQNPPCGQEHIYSQFMGSTRLFFFFFPNCETPKISFCREDTGITGNFFLEVVYHRCNKLLVPKGQSPGAPGLDQPNPTALQAQDHVLLSCSQARVQSGKSCPSSQCEVSMGEEVTTFQTRATALSGCTEPDPGVPGLSLQD